MIKVSVLYPNKEGARFDLAYYIATHMPMVQQKMGAACRKIGVDQGLAGGAPGTPAPYLAIGHIYCDTLEAFQAGFGPHAKAILADVPNYTNIQPVMQISEVKL